ncbi:hypothetical protein MMC25_005201 [Agyrium rufum]|nr:hypothetical protein [Agyrium rufum]
MSSLINKANGTALPKSILTLSASRHLSGVPIAQGLQREWAKDKANKSRDSFDNVGFDVDPKDASGALEGIKRELSCRPWDGIVIGWCLRGHVEFTDLFEQVIATCVDATRSAPQTKIMFSTGPDNLVETVERNFGSGKVA